MQSPFPPETDGGRGREREPAIRWGWRRSAPAPLGRGGTWRPRAGCGRARRWGNARPSEGRGVAWGGARGGEVAQVVVSSGAVGRFGAACTPFARLRRRAQKHVGDTFRIYPRVDPKSAARPVFYLARSRELVAWPPLSLLTGCGSPRLRALGSVPPPHLEPSSCLCAGLV